MHQQFLKQGAEVEVAITLIDKRTRKVNLSMKAKDSVEEKAAWKTIIVNHHKLLAQHLVIF